MRMLGLVLTAGVMALPVQPLSAQQAPNGDGEQVTAGEWLKVPVTGLQVAGAPKPPEIENPYAGNEQAIQQGQQLFDAMNCSGCHAPMGGGGMGPPLSDEQWLYGGRPADVFLSIQQGRPNGMPSWGHIGEDSIWMMVAYIRSLNEQVETFAEARR